MINRIDDSVPMNELPTWLQELWELKPYIARRAEKHYLELLQQVKNNDLLHSVSVSFPSKDCDESCYYHCTKGGQQPPNCINEH